MIVAIKRTKGSGECLHMPRLTGAYVAQSLGVEERVDPESFVRGGPNLIMFFLYTFFLFFFFR